MDKEDVEHLIQKKRKLGKQDANDLISKTEDKQLDLLTEKAWGALCVLWALGSAGFFIYSWLTEGILLSEDTILATGSFLCACHFAFRAQQAISIERAHVEETKRELGQALGVDKLRGGELSFHDSPAAEKGDLSMSRKKNKSRRR